MFTGEFSQSWDTKSNEVLKIVIVLKPEKGEAGFSGAAISTLGLEYHEADHDRDQTYWSYYQSEDDGWRRVAQFLCGTIPEELGVNVHKYLFHERVGPWDQKTVKHFLCAKAEVAVQTAVWRRQKVPASSRSLDINNVYIFCSQARATYPLTLPQLHQSFLLRESISSSKILRQAFWRSREMQSVVGRPYNW